MVNVTNNGKTCFFDHGGGQTDHVSATPSTSVLDLDPVLGNAYSYIHV